MEVLAPILAAGSGAAFVAPTAPASSPGAPAALRGASTKSASVDTPPAAALSAAAATLGATALAQRRRAQHRSKQTVTARRSGTPAAPIMPEDFTDVCDQTGVTLNRYMIEMTKRGVVDQDMNSIISSIREATKVIAKLVNRAPLSQADLLGLEGEVNVQGEDQKKLDVITNDVLKKALRYSGKLGTLASEEEDNPVAVDEEPFQSFDNDAVLAETGKYICVFDPLDGSSNVDAGIAVGTIFGIFREKEAIECQIPEGASLEDLDDAQLQCLAGTLQPGKDLVAAGYVLYSCSTEMVITLGRGCIGFTLDTSIGEYVLTRPHIVIPPRGKIYSANEANISQWDAPMREYVRDIQEGKGETGTMYSLRYIGSMVGDVHRTLLYGGIFAYPADKKNVNGKLRLLYEGAPMSFIVEQAGGKAITGHSRVMDIPPVGVHQRVPVILGSKEDVEECQKYFDRCDDPALKERCERRLKGEMA